MATLGTFTAGQVLTAAELNQLNNVTALAGASQTINSTTETLISFDAAGEVVVDVSNWHSTSSNPSRITVDKAGIYLVTAFLQLNYNGANALMSVQIKKNGTTVVEDNTTNGSFPSCSPSTVVAASANDYFALNVYQATGAPAGIYLDRCAFSVILLRTT